jgi:hypothetical protein
LHPSFRRVIIKVQASDNQGGITVNQEHTTDLSQLFGAALQKIKESRQQINDLDGYNGNHGDNMVQNLCVIRDAVEAHADETPSDALRWAGQELAARGQGGTSQYYVRGLNQAAEQLEGHTEMRQGEVMTLVQNLLGSVPQQGHPQQIKEGGSVLDQMLGMAGGQFTSQVEGSPLASLLGGQQGQTPDGSSGSPLEGFLDNQTVPGGGAGSPMDAFLGGQGGSGGADQPQDLGGLSALVSQALGQDPSQGVGEQTPSAQDEVGGGGIGSLLGTLMGGGATIGGGGGLSQPGQPQADDGGNWLQMLLPSALAFLQARQAGAEAPQAAGQALLAVLGGGQVDPLQSGAPRPAAGGLIAQSLLQAFMNR